MEDDRLLKNRNWKDVFSNAYNGLTAAISTQKNFKIHFAISLLVIFLGFWLNISITHKAILFLTITFGLTIETINTAFEKTVDLVTNQYHPLARAAKDISAGAMLIFSIGAAIIGIIILFPPLWQKIL